MLRLILTAMVVVAASQTATAQVDTFNDINNIRKATPPCQANPNSPIRGRVSGNTTGALDQTIPVSFVGCFKTMRECDRWRGQASRIIDSTIIQYSCEPR